MLPTRGSAEHNHHHRHHPLTGRSPRRKPPTAAADGRAPRSASRQSARSRSKGALSIPGDEAFRASNSRINTPKL